MTDRRCPPRILPGTASLRAQGAATMRLPCLSAAAVVCDVLLLLSVSGIVVAADVATDDKKEPAGPLWIQPSGEWFVPCSLCALLVSRCVLFSNPPCRYGIDGTWSNFMFAVGSPATLVYLTPATTLSEIWTISTGGCYDGEHFFVQT